MYNDELLYSQYSDTELLNLVKHDNFWAFDEIYKRHRKSLIELANKKLLSNYMVEDIVQDIFISLYQRRASLEITISLRGYLVQALKFKISNEIRSSIIRSKYQKFLFFSKVCEIDFANLAESNELYYKVDSTIKRLPSKCRQAFVLSRYEGQSYQNISESLNISVSTVEKHIVKALKIMRSSLNEYMMAS